MHQFKIESGAGENFALGITKIDGGIRAAVVADAEECALLLYPSGSRARQGEEQKETARLVFPEEGRTGNVWTMTVLGDNFDRYDYAFEADGVRFEDPRGRSFDGHERWGKKELGHILLKTPIVQPDFDWENDQPPKHPYEEMIVYRLHVRGFTRHSSSGVEARGTFAGIIEKIPYLKELGVTTLELMPSTEFNEVMLRPVQTPHRDKENGQMVLTPDFEPDGRLNYWGYGPSFLFAPKASYAGKGKHPVTEFKNLVKTLHRENLSVVTELFFTGKESPSEVLEAARFWVQEFHVDGLHISGNAPLALLASDPYLADTMLWATSWDGIETGRHTGKSARSGKHPRRLLGEYNDGFLVDMRRVLKGDEGQMGALAFRTRRNPETMGVLNYMAASNGFTMADMVSYEQKHNEANGEENRDGTDYNCSWNCGAEGPVRRKKVRALRKKQLRNAILLLMLSQGTPILLAGDEFGNSQDGNNNAYCQDNEISWLNWNNQKTNADQLEFMKRAISFRKEHPVFHQPTEPKLMDSLACGQPDVSYHGVSAWKPEFDSFRRQFGILYCGEYAKKADGQPDDTFFVVYNMHWEPHEFALPTLPSGQKWHMVFQTADEAQNGFYEAGKEPELKSQKKFMAPSRSIAVFVGKTVEKP